MKCAIIGASGFIGRALSQRLGTDGHEVVGYDRQPCEQLGVAELDVRSAEIQLDAGTDAVLYLSQSPYYRSFPMHADDLFGVNVVGAAQAAAAAKKAGARLFVYASTGNVYKKSFEQLSEQSPVEGDDAYSLSKIMGETAVRAMAGEMQTLIVRIFGAFGPGQQSMLVPTLAERIRQRQAITIQQHPTNQEDLNGLAVSLMFVNDLINALVTMIHDMLDGNIHEETVNLGGPTGVSIRDLAEHLGEVLGEKPVFEVSDATRGFDLVADIRRLQSLVNPAFTPLSEALAETVCCDT